jgi:asparagine synthase (glutamine-hydrolysing)
MCGIAGAVALDGGAPIAPSTLKAMCDTIAHRGPDDEGFCFGANGTVAMGMRRLAIIDLASGQQPIFNEDETVATVYNGEIYNFRELRAELEAKGHRFRTRSDTEVIVHLWEEEGADFVARLNGMFAIALHDRKRRKFLLARDHLGIKPLYWGRSNGHLVFGSEIKALLASGLVERRLAVDSLKQFLSWEYVPSPGTLLRDVYKLEPSQLLMLDLDTGRQEVRYFWDVPAPNGEGARSTADWAEAVDARIRDAVRAQLVSDVPLGALLSGGVDSSLVAAGMGAGKAFSIGFDDPTYDELTWARRVASHLGLDHRTEVIRPDVGVLFDMLMRFMDDPIADFSIFPTFLVSRLARQEVTVALSGDGGDELFGGYETYLAQAAAGAWQRLPRPVRARLIAPLVERLRPSPKKKGLVNKVKRFVEGAVMPPSLGHARWRLFASEALHDGLLSVDAAAAASTPVASHIDALFARAGARSEIDRGLYVDLKSYLPDNCLVKVDRMSMAVSLELRVPLLDKEVVELAFAMPDRLKVAGGTTKVLLKQIAARHVPRSCIYRPKQGFSIPIKNWLKGEFRPMMDELLAPARLDGVFEPRTVERLKREHLEERANHSHVLWALIVFQDWRQRWRV